MYISHCWCLWFYWHCNPLLPYSHCGTFFPLHDRSIPCQVSTSWVGLIRTKDEKIELRFLPCSWNLRIVRYSISNQWHLLLQCRTMMCIDPWSSIISCCTLKPSIVETRWKLLFSRNAQSKSPTVGAATTWVLANAPSARSRGYVRVWNLGVN